MKAVVYPNLLQKGDYSNPYIDDFILALEQCGIEIENKPHKNPLISLWYLKQQSDYYFFHWIENVPDYKYGYLQSLFACLYILYLRIKRKKIIWFLHNKKTHTGYRTFMNGLLLKFMARYSTMVVTHSREGISYVETLCHGSSVKTHFLDHPTKNRLSGATSDRGSYCRDILIWGTITPHKRVKEFLEFHRRHQLKLRVKVVGKYYSKELWEAICSLKSEYIELQGTGISFEELKEEIALSRFVLIPYAPGSLLSSGTMMDSLSFGARVIGPDVGSFKDYSSSEEIRVYTFKEFADIPRIVNDNTGIPDCTLGYKRFLNRTSWPVFMKQLLDKVEN